MNFLELCQDLAREAGISGAIVAVERQNGEAGRVVNWIIKAYRYIQNKHVDWTFMRADVSFDTNTSSAIYTAAAAGVAGFGEWCFVGDDWRAYNKAIGYADEQALSFMPYDDFKRVYGMGANRTIVGRPQIVTVRPDQSLQIWPLPDATYTIVGEQYRAPLTLAKAEDVPIFAAKFHDAIVQRALMFYGAFEGDAGVFASAQTEFQRLLAQMEGVYMPEWESAGAMA
jgi:hypothetical protein